MNDESGGRSDGAGPPMVGDKPQRCNSLCGFSSAILTRDVGAWIPAFAGMTISAAGVTRRECVSGDVGTPMAGKDGPVVGSLGS